MEDVVWSASVHLYIIIKAMPKQEYGGYDMVENTGAKEAVFLINGSRFLHLREAGRDVGYATYDVGTGEQLENGLIPYKHLPPDEKYKLQAARNWYLFELSDFQAPVVIQQESVNILKKYPASGVDKRIMCDDETIPKDDVRIIAGYDYDIHRVPNGSVINIDFPNGNVVSEIVNHVDDCHLSVAGIDLVFNIREFYQKFCVEAGAVVYPEFLTQETKAAWLLFEKGLKKPNYSEFGCSTAEEADKIITKAINASDLSKMKKVSLKSTTTPTTSPFTAAAKRNRRKPKNFWTLQIVTCTGARPQKDRQRKRMRISSGMSWDGILRPNTLVP